MIPKVIHYCWFGGGTLSEKEKKCIDSWKKMCPDYEIRRWDENNYNVHGNQYMSDAYKNHKWGFVSDYARFDIIYNEGGFYLDTDVELVKSLDSLLEEKCYMGFENGNWVATGLGFGAEKHNAIIKELRDWYNDISFYKENGELNLTPIPHYTTAYLEKKGLVRKNVFQRLEGVTIYPTEYFAPKDYYTGKTKLTSYTISIHHYTASWQTPHQRRMLIVRRLLGNSIYNKLVDLKNILCKKSRK